MSTTKEYYEEMTEWAYENYYEALDGVSYNGESMQSWDELIRSASNLEYVNAWRRATQKLIELDRENHIPDEL